MYTMRCDINIWPELINDYNQSYAFQIRLPAHNTSSHNEQIKNLIA